MKVFIWIACCLAPLMICASLEDAELLLLLLEGGAVGLAIYLCKKWDKHTAKSPVQQINPAEPTQAEPTQAEPEKVERHRVAGTSFRMTDIMSLGVENDDYSLTKRMMIDEGLIGERVYKMDFYAYDVELLPEPENPEDPRAIRVVVDDVHIGYIKKGSCAHIHNLLREGKIESIECEIKGGQYKILLEDCDEYGKDTYELEKDEAPIYADLFIKIK